MEQFDMNIFRNDILNTIREFILVLDSKLNIIYANSSFYEKFSVTPSETINKNIYDLGNGQWNIPELHKLLEDILPKNTFFTKFKVEHTFPKIGKRIMIINAKQLQDGTRKEQYLFLSIDDITEQSKLLELSLQTNKLAMIGQLSSGIAHGLSSPLTGIHNFLDVYAKEEPTESDRYKEFELMLEACNYMNKIVKNLTYFARTTKEVAEELSWKDIIDSTLSFTERQFTTVNIFIEKDLPDNIKTIQGHKGQLQHVLLNILMNAKEAIGNTGKIIIKAKNSEADNRVILKIKDTGKGISKNNLSHVFEPFFTTKSDKTGAGLGLAAAYGIIKDHHGEIIIESEEGKGTTVIIKLPLKK